MQISLHDFKETDKQIKAEKRKLREEESLANANAIGEERGRPA